MWGLRTRPGLGLPRGPYFGQGRRGRRLSDGRLGSSRFEGGYDADGAAVGHQHGGAGELGDELAAGHARRHATAPSKRPSVLSRRVVLGRWILLQPGIAGRASRLLGCPRVCRRRVGRVGARVAARALVGCVGPQVGHTHCDASPERIRDGSPRRRRATPPDEASPARRDWLRCPHTPQPAQPRRARRQSRWPKQLRPLPGAAVLVRGRRLGLQRLGLQLGGGGRSRDPCG